ncbi:MAG: DUF6716 putative glycosyltransferase, partial [Aeromicrobium sp.]
MLAQTKRSVLLIAAFDSQLKWCAGIRDELEARGFACRAVVPDLRSALSDRQIRDAGFESVTHLPWDELLTEALASDVVVCSLTGPITQRLTTQISQTSRLHGGVGPILVVGWVGIIIEKITAGYLDRCGSDLIAVNSAQDLTHFSNAAAKLGIPGDNLVLTGLPFLSSEPLPARSGSIGTVLYADQPTVPAAEVERRYVYRKLMDYARAHPDREVLLKPRHRPDEDTFHRMRHHPEDVLAGEALPANFHIDYTPINEMLPKVDLLLTMSSTACLEAIDHGSRVALVLDLGIHERYGNHVFLDSGLLRTFDQIAADDIGEPSKEWHASWFAGRDRPANQIIADRIEELLASGARPSHAVWDSPYFQSASELQLVKERDTSRWMSQLWSRRVR